MKNNSLPIPSFPDRNSYMQYCSSVANDMRQDLSTPCFAEHREIIRAGGQSTIQTNWGGVHVLSYEHPEVEKFLVVDQGKFLAFEKHSEKIETLFCEEGLGVLVFKCTSTAELRAEIIEPGWTRTLNPGQEHTIIALSNLLVRERSTDPLGMDQDLIFIFTP